MQGDRLKSDADGISIKTGEAISMNETRNEGLMKRELSTIHKRYESADPMRTVDESEFERKKMVAVDNAGDAIHKTICPEVPRCLQPSRSWYRTQEWYQCD